MRNHLFGDGAGTADGRARTDIEPQRGEPGRPVDAVMLVEMLIFRHDEGGLQRDWNVGERAPRPCSRAFSSV